MIILIQSPFARNHKLRDASWQAVHEAMKSDPMLHVFGEGAEVKAHYDAPAMLAEFPDRIHTMPISEDGNLNFACGASLLGIHPIVDVISCDFLFRCMDSLVNTAAKLRDKTLVVRCETMIGGPTTGQRPESALAHVPGLRVVVPSTPRDAYALMKEALESHGVTVYIEDRMVADSGPWLPEDLEVGVLGGQYRRMGQRGQPLLATYGVMRQRCDALVEEKGDPYREPNYDCGIFDLRKVSHVDYWLILKALDRSGSLVIVEPDVVEYGIGAEIAARLVEMRPGLKVRRVGARRQTVGAAPSLHGAALPTEAEIKEAIDAITR